MVYLNYYNFDGETHERLLKQSRRQIEEKYGNELHTCFKYKNLRTESRTLYYMVPNGVILY